MAVWTRFLLKARTVRRYLAASKVVFRFREWLQDFLGAGEMIDRAATAQMQAQRAKQQAAAAAVNARDAQMKVERQLIEVERKLNLLEGKSRLGGQDLPFNEALERQLAQTRFDFQNFRDRFEGRMIGLRSSIEVHGRSISEIDSAVFGTKGEVIDVEKGIPVFADIPGLVDRVEALESRLKPQESRMETMDFGGALAALKAEKKVSRLGWNSKGMFIVLMPPLYLPPYNTADTARKVNDRTAKWIGEDAPLDCQPYIAMYTADKLWQPGWLASQADLLAEDWVVVD